MRCGETKVTARAADGPYRRFVLPTINPWEMVLIRV
jgi:hypothetical protein